MLGRRSTVDGRLTGLTPRELAIDDYDIDIDINTDILDPRVQRLASVSYQFAAKSSDAVPPGWPIRDWIRGAVAFMGV